jgi:hypothetical protein
MAETVKVDDIQDGMTLAEPIVNNFGQAILAGGVSLKLKHKMLLKTWNIEQVVIKSSDDEEILVDSSDLKALAKEQFMKRLMWQPENDFEHEIVSIGIKNLADRMIKAEQKG